MNKKIKNAVFAGGMSFVLALNFLMPNITKAQGVAYANQIESSNTSRQTALPGSSLSAGALAIAAIFVVTALVDGLHATDDVSTNIHNLD